MNIVQVGTNNSLDECYDFIIKNKDKIQNIFLIEPLPSCIEKIKKVFTGIKNVKIFNVAITSDEEIKKIEFYFPSHDPISQVASFNKTHVIAHGQILGYGANNISSITINCITLEEFFKKMNIIECERLYIDTEGYDCEILLGFDFNKYNIKYIEFERIHSDGVWKMGDNFKKCVEKFKKLGYTIENSGDFNCVAKKQ